MADQLFSLSELLGDMLLLYLVLIVPCLVTFARGTADLVFMDEDGSEDEDIRHVKHPGAPTQVTDKQ